MRKLLILLIFLALINSVYGIANFSMGCFSCGNFSINTLPVVLSAISPTDGGFFDGTPLNMNISYIDYDNDSFVNVSWYINNTLNQTPQGNTSTGINLGVS